jgi:hypothetical protein
MTPTFDITAEEIRRGFLEGQIAVMLSYHEENRTIEREDPGEHFGKHNNECGDVTIAEWSYYCVIILRFALEI